MRHTLLLTITLISANLAACHYPGPMVETLGDYVGEVVTGGKKICSYRMGSLAGQLEVGMMERCPRQAAVY
jgi:hypothetical protein